MYCWLLLQIYLCYLWLVLCSRVTNILMFSKNEGLTGLERHEGELLMTELKFVGDGPEDWRGVKVKERGTNLWGTGADGTCGCLSSVS